MARPVLMGTVMGLVAPILKAGPVAEPVMALTLGAITARTVWPAIVEIALLAPVDWTAVAVLRLPVEALAAVFAALIAEAILPVELAVPVGSLPILTVPVLAVALLIVPVGTVVVAVEAIAETTLVVVVLTMGTRLLAIVRPLTLGTRSNRRLVGKARNHGLIPVAEIIVAAVFVREIVVDGIACDAHARRDIAARGTAGDFATLLDLLFAIGENDAIVMLCVLQIIFSQNGIAGRLRVASKRNVFFRNVRWRSADLHVGTVGLETSRQRVLAFAVVVIVIVVIGITAIVVVTTTATSMLLSLPHGLPFSR